MKDKKWWCEFCGQDGGECSNCKAIEVFYVDAQSEAESGTEGTPQAVPAVRDPLHQRRPVPRGWLSTELDGGPEGVPGVRDGVPPEGTAPA